MTIPKIIHCIAPKDKSLWHPFWHVCNESWQSKFIDFEFKFWNDQEDIDKLIHSYYPEFSSLYNLFPFQIMKIDFARLCILHKFGGIYMDMDYYVYKNFYDKLDGRVGFLENLTEEYTSASCENSLMYSLEKHELLYELMKYVKACFIHHRNQFQLDNKNFRSVENDKAINNTTGSGMITEGTKYFKKYFDIKLLDCKTFNNRPGSFDYSFYGKHLHTSLWGNEYCINQPTHIIFCNGMMYQAHSNEIDQIKHKDCLVIKIEDFNVMNDYTDGKYLKSDNLEEIKTLIKNSYL
jgi:hypothetical protein